MVTRVFTFYAYSQTFKGGILLDSAIVRGSTIRSNIVVVPQSGVFLRQSYTQQMVIK
jgi:hypothetical protein